MLDLIDQGIGYFREGLEWIRIGVTKISEFLPWESQLSLTILFLLTSLWLSYMITKRYTIKPFGLSSLPWLVIIAISIYLNLMYI